MYDFLLGCAPIGIEKAQMKGEAFACECGTNGTVSAGMSAKQGRRERGQEKEKGDGQTDRRAGSTDGETCTKGALVKQLKTSETGRKREQEAKAVAEQEGCCSGVSARKGEGERNKNKMNEA